MKKTYAAVVGSMALLAGCSPQPTEAPVQREVTGVIAPAPKPLPAAKVIKTKDKVKLTKQEFECLARNVYHEAGVESAAGKIAVAQVTLNRVKSKKWGKGICDVVYSKAQFSWTLTKKKRWAQPKGKLWEASVEAVKQVEEGTRVQQLMSSLFYHTDYIKKPNWADPSLVVAKVGQHIFYADARKS